MENNETQEAPPQQEVKEEAAPEGKPAEDTGDRKPVETKNLSKIEEAAQLAERIEKGNQVMLKNIERLEKLKADEMLSGRSFAGQPTEKPKEQESASKEKE